MLYVFSGAKRIVTTNVNSGNRQHPQLREIARRSASRRPSSGWSRHARRAQWLAPRMSPRSHPPARRRLDRNREYPSARGDEGFDVSPDGKEAWVANAGDGTVSIVDLDAKRVTATLPLNVQSANRLKFTPDGKRVLISMLGQGDLLVVDIAMHQPVKRIPIGHGAAGILVQPDGARAFVACTPDNYVAVIDLNTLTVTGRIQSGGGPDGMDWAVRQ